MEEFYTFLSRVGAFLPDLVSLILCPALLVLAALPLLLFRKEKAYSLLAAGLGAAGYFLVFCERPSDGAGVALAYLALYAVLAVLLRALFFLPRKGKEGDSEELYRKFAVPLETGGSPAEAEAELDAEESGVRLDHAASLIERLGALELSASDRLEVDALSRTLEGFRSRALTADETRAVNDCLSTILKLTAKYNL